MKKLQAGTAIIDVTPAKPMFLHGYPHVERISEGVNDPLYASALILDSGEKQVCFCAVDVIFISKEITNEVRKGVTSATGIPAHHIMVSASHTHSGPVTVSDHFNDPVVPKADPEYVAVLIEKLIEVCVEAHANRRQSLIALAVADGSGIGGNRRSKTDVVDAQVPVLVIKDALMDKLMAISVVCCMHPTVLHEDSKLVSGDFPGFTRGFISREMGMDVVMLYSMGPSGNQSPRHFIKSNTLEEAKRLGELLGKRIFKAVNELDDLAFQDQVAVDIIRSEVVLPRKKFMSLEAATRKLEQVKEKLEQMRSEGAPSAEVRTVECDWFGAEENMYLAAMASNGTLERVYQAVLPAEVTIISIADFRFVFLPGELFVEYSLAIKTRALENTFVVSLSNGLLGGYIVTEEAEKEGGYEASNGIFPAVSGKILVNEVLALLRHNKEKIEG